MTLKEELEILRGEPIEVFTGDPMDISCIETSDPEKLCKHPVVSVHMITYNHEPYIRQAIEGVMMQKTDFEFELVIGEDASQDKTREICFEYQKKYPDKIRVLWWHENLRKVNHPGGGNSRRVYARCRGEFIALCEGDDYWIDPLKLQKQVDVMRKNPSVGFCFTGAFIKNELKAGCERLQSFSEFRWNEDGLAKWDPLEYPPGFIEQHKFFALRGLYPRTATFMIRVSALGISKNKYDIFSWRLRVGDKLLWWALACVCDAWFIPDPTAVYRLNGGGVCVRDGAKCYRDGFVIEEYFNQMLDLPREDRMNTRGQFFKLDFQAWEETDGRLLSLLRIIRRYSWGVVLHNKRFVFLVYLLCRAIGLSVDFNTVIRAYKRLKGWFRRRSA